MNTSLSFVALSKPRALAALAASLAALLYLYRRSNKNSPYSDIPKEPEYGYNQIVKFIITDAYKVDTGRRHVDMVQNERYRHIVKIKDISRTTLMVTSPSILHDLLVEGQRNYRNGFTVERDPDFTKLHQLIFAGPNTANLSGEDWKWRRKLMVPLFQPRKIVPELFPFALERTIQLVDTLASMDKNTGVSVDELLVLTTFDIICKYLFGRAGPDELDFSAINGYDNVKKTMATLLESFVRSLFWMLIPLVGRTKWAQEPSLAARTTLKNFTRAAILRSLADEVKEGELVPVVKILAQEQRFDPNTPEGLELLTSEMLMLIFAGHDTTAYTISFALGRIAQDPKIQSSILDEANSILGPDPMNPHRITAADLSRLTYTTAVIRETGRMYPAAPRVSIKTVKDVDVGGYRIAANTYIWGSLRTCSMNPDVFVEPMRFDPERWLQVEQGDAFEDLNQGGVSGNGRLPEINFSMGAHICLGKNLVVLEMRTVISMLVHRFEIALVPGYEIQPVQPGLMRPKGGMWLTFKERA